MTTPRPIATFSRADRDSPDGVDVLTAAGVSVGLHVGPAGEVYIVIITEDAETAFRDGRGRLAHLTVVLPREARLERSKSGSYRWSWWRRSWRRSHRPAGGGRQRRGALRGRGPGRRRPALFLGNLRLRSSFRVSTGSPEADVVIIPSPHWDDLECVVLASSLRRPGLAVTGKLDGTGTFEAAVTLWSTN
ncbi:hypothetical protein LN042_23110 [Kitasatospora sp. RB6PN24]|uniref:hypothetical protein n=1 Tax=Kitasatospora humi TaxID=2893891 RepID=UPI001E3FD4F2|nr:hypothetical protein [Kitasatospora humi]MCC9309926.1 hypothetical protein [Kitasatospora humi]